MRTANKYTFEVLRRTAMDNADLFDTITVETLLRSFYVDDCLRSVKDSNVAIRLVEQGWV